MHLDRIDSLPTDSIAGFRVRPGRPLPFGASHTAAGINFSIYTSSDTAARWLYLSLETPNHMRKYLFLKVTALEMCTAS